MVDVIIIVTLRTTTAMTMAMAAIAAIRGEAQIPGLLLPQWNGWQGHVISWGPWWGGLFKEWRNETCKDDFKICGTQQVIDISIPKQHQSLTLCFQKSYRVEKYVGRQLILDRACIVMVGQGLFFFSGKGKRGPKWRFLAIFEVKVKYFPVPWSSKGSDMVFLICRAQRVTDTLPLPNIFSNAQPNPVQFCKSSGIR